MKAARFLMVGLAVCALATAAAADTFTYRPSDLDIYDLDHGRYYTWGMERLWDDDEEVIAASLFFDDIRNWNNSSNDLFVRLLDTGPMGLVSYRDDHRETVDAFDGQGVLLVHYEDLPDTAQDLTVTFSVNQLLALNTFADNGNDFMVALDPDCHFYNSGVSLSVTTSPEETPDIPEPATLGLVVLGGIGAILHRRRNRR